MYDMFAAMRARVVAALAELLPEQPAEAFSRVVVEPPKDASHGDMATNAAMVVAKAAKLAPPKLAAALAAKLAALPEVAEATPAGPGFLNIRLAPAFLRGQLAQLLRMGEAYGDAPPNGRRVNVEYVSANPTGPMHVGHCRGAVVGDALANLLAKAGYDVTKEYYINDAGSQIDKLAETAFLRYREALGEEIGEKHPFDWQLEKWNKTRVGFGSYDDSRLTEEEKAQYDLWSKWTSFYGRDRGEDGVEAKTAPHRLSFFEQDMGTEYWYLMTRDGEWLVKIGDGAEPITLKSAWAREQAENEAAKLQDHAEDLSIIP